MKILQVNSMDNKMSANSIKKSAKDSTQFINIINKEISEQSTYSIQNELKNKYNANLHVCSFDSYNYTMNSTDSNSLNNVVISNETLKKMVRDEKFKAKICKIINDNCSPEAQKELRSLAPPVKSSGVVIYPDGTYVCWVESAYSKNDTNKDKVEKGTENPFTTSFDEIGKQINNQYINFSNIINRQVIGYIKQKKNHKL
ncbi:DUF6033 family protein [Clostridium tetanomorphum]|uniref:Uncharacterized protein n=1 Tax=Clostridium tetanomorphum TaxID=1553 RepID=A0A923E980_CLOTT|nr:DUF6033 family protein [Clostridium tetanomorphum]MBC2397414.1 hypothetical protein [Clostridium tetanomorphum]MBP1863567.1 hypothetical protein [Clostridium tetanomorphum]NRZ95834.1 hypothetical protein [Clostridium tetanomorphum]